MSAAEDAMDTMTAQYYNALTAGATLDPSQFQLAQGAISLGTDSSSIWRFFDSLPPPSVNNFFQTSGLNSLANAYGAVLNNLIPQTNNEAQGLLKDKYVKWQEWLPTHPLKNEDGTAFTKFSDQAALAAANIARFNEWAYNYSGGLAEADISAMQTLMGQRDLITTAMSQLSAAKTGKGFAYTAFVTGLGDAINRGRSCGFKLNSKTQNKELNQKWAKAQMSGKYWFVTAGANAEWDHTIENIANSGVTMDVSFQKVATLPGGPYGLSTQMNPDLIGYTPWYNSEALNAARTQNDNRLWKHSAPTWEQTFGPKGNLQTATTALVVVDGVTSKLTTTAKIQKSDHEKFKAAAKLGVFPWFSAEGSGGFTNNVDFNDDGSFTITSEAKQGNPNVLGMLVTSIQDAFN